ncbi:MAG: hypothetical protein O7E57_15010 [Gammaproteobacteria bacterium]|nr:hypothetical protein [Gammaproteobacteria bacterium]
MKHIGRAALFLTLATALSAPVFAAPEGDPTALAMTGDLIIARPMGAVITLVGAVAFVVSLPFSAAGGNVGQAAETLVIGPARATFVRCLGCTSSGKRQKSN